MRLIVLVTLCSLLAACVQPPPATVGEAFTGRIDIYGKEIPLPPGTWKVVRAGVTQQETFYKGNMAGDMGTVILVSVRQSSPIAILIATDKEGVGDGWVSNPLCEQADALARETRFNIFGGDQECWWVTEHPGRAWAGLSAQAGINVPEKFFAVGIHLATTSSLIQVMYVFRSDKVSGVEELERWAREWLPKAKTAL